MALLQHRCGNVQRRHPRGEILLLQVSVLHHEYHGGPCCCCGALRVYHFDTCIIHTKVQTVSAKVISPSSHNHASRQYGARTGPIRRGGTTIGEVDGPSSLP